MLLMSSTNIGMMMMAVVQYEFQNISIWKPINAFAHPLATVMEDLHHLKMCMPALILSSNLFEFRHGSRALDHETWGWPQARHSAC